MRAKKIYFLSTEKDTYSLRNDLFDAGVTWDAYRKAWWSEGKVAAKRAASLIGDGVEIVETITKRPPRLATSFQGGRPRKPRTQRQKRVVAALDANNGNGHSPTIPILANAQPFVRQSGDTRRQEDRRAKGERRAANRPPAVLCVPVSATAVE